MWRAILETVSQPLCLTGHVSMRLSHVDPWRRARPLSSPLRRTPVCFPAGIPYLAVHGAVRSARSCRRSRERPAGRAVRRGSSPT